MAKKIIIIGAGLGALSAAARLATKGHQVRVYEASNTYGGKAGVLVQGKFRFDYGPSIVTMKSVYEDLFAECNENIYDYLNFEPLDPLIKYFFPDGKKFTVKQDINQFVADCEKILGVNSKTILSYLKYAQNLYNNSAEVFLKNSIHDPKFLLSSKFIKAIPGLVKLDIFRSMHKANSHFFDNPNALLMFDRYATYNGSNPYQAPAIFNLLAHVEHGMFSYAISGGIRKLAQVIFELCIRKGVKFHFSHKVEEIMVEGNKVTGVKLSTKDIISSDIVISNADIYSTYNKLTKTNKNIKIPSPDKLSTSALIFYWGIKHSFKQLLYHNIFFSNNYKAEFDSISEGIYPSNYDPTIYLNITSKHNKTDAPTGCENWFVHINVSAKHMDKTSANKLREKIISKFNKILNIDISKLIVSEHMRRPQDIERETLSTCGAIYGPSSNSISDALSRHPNKSKKYNGLYLVGGSVHPGAGMPIVTLSGKIVSDLIE